MDKLKISYGIISKDKAKRIDQGLFFIAAFLLLTGYIGTLDQFKGWFLVLPIIGFFVVIVNVVMIIWYDKFQIKFGSLFELYAFRLNGAILLITAFGFQFDGKQLLQYVYYALSVFYFVLLPRLIIKTRGKMILEMDDDGYTDNRTLSNPIKIYWSEVKEVKLENNLLIISTKLKTKQKRYFLSLKDASEFAKLKERLKYAELANKFYLNMSEVNN